MPTSNKIDSEKFSNYLKNIPIPLLFEPWKMSKIEQTLYNCKIDKDYPKPIVDHATAIRDAKTKLSSIFKKDGYRKNSNIVFKRIFSKIDLRPLAPVFFEIAFFAISKIASS